MDRLPPSVLYLIERYVGDGRLAVAYPKWAREPDEWILVQYRPAIVRLPRMATSGKTDQRP